MYLQPAVLAKHDMGQHPQSYAVAAVVFTVCCALHCFLLWMAAWLSLSGSISECCVGAGAVHHCYRAVWWVLAASLTSTWEQGVPDSMCDPASGPRIIASCWHHATQMPILLLPQSTGFTFSCPFCYYRRPNPHTPRTCFCGWDPASGRLLPLSPWQPCCPWLLLWATAPHSVGPSV